MEKKPCHRLREMREMLGLSQAEAATLAGYKNANASSWDYYENEEKFPKLLPIKFIEKIMAPFMQRGIEKRELLALAFNTEDGSIITSSISAPRIEDKNYMGIAEAVDKWIVQHKLTVPRLVFAATVQYLTSWYEAEMISGREPQKDDLAFKAGQYLHEIMKVDS